MNCMETICELIETLNDCEPEDYVKIAKNIHIPSSEFETYALWKPNGYTRNCIERTSDYELLLLCWQPGDETPIHGHNEQRCWVRQVEGMLTEVRYHEDDQGDMIEDNQMVLTPGRLSFMQDEMGYHALKNNTDERAMTLHLYISPIDNCRSFDASKKKFCDKQLQYDSYKGVLTETFTSI